MSISNCITSVVEFFGHLTKEPFEQVGGVLADQIRYYRVKRAVLLKEKLEGFLNKRGITNYQELSLKLTYEILDGATIEDNEELHTTWAQLLANAVDPNFKHEVKVAYTDILRSLNALDVRLLNEIYVAYQLSDLIHKHVEVNLVEIANRIRVGQIDIELSRDCLMRQQCIIQAPNTIQPGQQITHDGEGQAKWITPPPVYAGVQEYVVKLTPLGKAFAECCSNPESKIVTVEAPKSEVTETE